MNSTKSQRVGYRWIFYVERCYWIFFRSLWINWMLSLWSFSCKPPGLFFNKVSCFLWCFFCE